MFFWFFMLSANLFVPLVMAFSAYIIKINPPAYKDNFYGYRTKSSFSSPEAWEYAQIYISRLWFRLSIIQALIIVSVYLCLIGKTVNFLALTGLIITLASLLSFFICIGLTELALKRRFKS